MRKQILAVTTVATVGLLGMSAAAQAQTAAPRVAAAPTTLRVPGGVATSVTPLCKTGTLSAFTYPAQPSSVIAVKKRRGLQLTGVWPVPATNQNQTITLTCSGVVQTDTLQVLVAPEPADIAGVGSQTVQGLVDQFGASYNAKQPLTSPHLYYWDAINPISGAIGDTIDIKDTSPPTNTCAQPRPNGSSAGITALETTNPTIDGHPCIDFAGSSRGRKSSDPDTISFVNLAEDGVTYATEPGTKGHTKGISNVPNDLTLAQLNEIYSCKITNWNQLPGGGNGTPEIYLPQASSGTRSFFLAAIGGSSFVPGPCASDLATTAEPGGTLEENEGVNPVFKTNPQDVIYIYSVGAYLSQRYHSAKCFNSACTAATSGPDAGQICAPTKSQNLFGCDIHGTMVLNAVTNTAVPPVVTTPTTPYPLTNSTTTATINTGFDPSLLRILYEVVENPTPGSSPPAIPAYLQPLFGPTGWACTNATAQAEIGDYGFLPLPQGNALGDCGVTS
jgi:ABC-type phosphate transport system substrate-binding protein